MFSVSKLKRGADKLRDIQSSISDIQNSIGDESNKNNMREGLTRVIQKSSPMFSSQAAADKHLDNIKNNPVRAKLDLVAITIKDILKQTFKT